MIYMLAINQVHCIVLGLMWRVISSVKKAYRRKAMELHPDRNYGNTEEATRQFADVQCAYDVLSDPQERVWYDYHREAILRGEEPCEKSDYQATHFNNARLTTARDIMALISRFNSTVPFTDQPGGFFATVRETFRLLAKEEADAAAFSGIETPVYPDFGQSDGAFEIARAFYSAWASFSTKKSFIWMDTSRASDALDRRTRRFIEKENKRIRAEAAREFNDTVRFLALFVRKRDPRMSAGRKTEVNREQTIRQATAAQAARSRAANQQRLAETELAAPTPPTIHTSARNDMDGEFSDSGESIESIRIVCIICNKTFKSENQHDAHERSKKHRKTVQLLQRES
jgi:DnaJ family protein A protein 5